jgi:hypothetical protein
MEQGSSLKGNARMRIAIPMNGNCFITGPWISSSGAIPGTSVTSAMHENSVTIGLAKSF